MGFLCKVTQAKIFKLQTLGWPQSPGYKSPPLIQSHHFANEGSKVQSTANTGGLDPAVQYCPVLAHLLFGQSMSSRLRRKAGEVLLWPCPPSRPHKGQRVCRTEKCLTSGLCYRSWELEISAQMTFNLCPESCRVLRDLFIRGETHTVPAQQGSKGGGYVLGCTHTVNMRWGRVPIHIRHGAGRRQGWREQESELGAGSQRLPSLHCHIPMEL